MIPEQHLVQQIADLINSDQLERTPVLEEYAEQYADLCLDVVARLQRCAEYLDRGMRSEAVHEATSSPSLLELVQIVQFDQVRKWENVVVDLDLAPFPRIPMDIVERLREECVTEEDLAPLLKEYRRYVYQADQDNCIRVLRQLREKDPGNPSWRENLAPLEEARLPALMQKAEQALQDDDKRLLRELYADMTHPQRLIEVPQDLRERVQEALLAERRVAAGQRGAALASRLHDAMNGGEGERIEALLQEWDALCEDDAFRPTGAMENVVDDARTLHHRTLQEKEVETAFNKAVEDLRQSLRDPRVSAADIHEKLEALEALRRPLPESLRSDVDEALNRIARRKQRRTQVYALGIILALIAVVSVSAWLLAQRHSRASREAQVRAWTALLEDGEYGRLSTALDRLRKTEPGFYDSAEVRHLLGQVESALETRKERTRQFEKVMSSLAQIRQAGYAADEEEIQRFLAEARQVAPDASAENTVDGWQSGWEQWQRRQRGQANEELARITALVRTILDDRTLNPFTAVSAEEEALGRVETLVKEAQPWLAKAGTEQANAFSAVAVEVESWRRDLEQRRTTQEQRRALLGQLRREIPAALPDLAQYRDLLQRFVDAFPEEDESSGYRRALNQMDACMKAILLKDFDLPTFPPGRVREARLRELAQNEALADSVWEEDIRRCIGYLDTNARVRQMMPRLVAGQSDMLRLQVIRYRPKGTGEWKRLYQPKPLMSRKERDEKGEYTHYWGMIYYCEGEQAPYLVHSGKVFDNGLTTREFDVEASETEQGNLVSHGRFLYRFVTEAVDADEMDIHLLNGIQALLEDETMATVPKAWLLKRLTHVLQQSYGDTIRQAGDMARLAESMPTEAPWMNPRHPEVVEAEQRIESLTADFPALAPIITRLRTSRAVLAAALSRHVRVAGFVHSNAQGSMMPAFVGPLPDRIWILSGSNPGVRPWFKVAGVRSDDGSIVYRMGIARELFEGQVLFAPADGRTCRELLRQAGVADAVDDVERPASWPVNAWEDD